MAKGGDLPPAQTNPTTTPPVSTVADPETTTEVPVVTTNPDTGQPDTAPNPTTQPPAPTQAPADADEVTTPDSQTTTNSGTTGPVNIGPNIQGTIGPNGYFIGFQPMAQTNWRSTTTTTRNCVGNNQGRGGNTFQTTTTHSSSVRRRYGCRLTAGRTWEDTERDLEITAGAQLSFMDGQGLIGLAAGFTISF